MFSVKYQLTSSASAELGISDGVNHAVVEVSYFSDPLRDLARAVIALLEGAWRFQFTQFVEPSEYHWSLIRRDGKVTIRIRRFKSEEQFHDPKDHGKKHLVAEGSLRDLAKAVLDQLNELYTTLGPEGYVKQWVDYSFPLAESTRLSALLEKDY
jgi:hypothetical protein